MTASDTKPGESRSGKSAYKTPELVHYGSLANITQNGNGTGGDGGTTAGMTMVSDVNAKENIVPIVW